MSDTSHIYRIQTKYEFHGNEPAVASSDTNLCYCGNKDAAVDSLLEQYVTLLGLVEDSSEVIFSEFNPINMTASVSYREGIHVLEVFKEPLVGEVPLTRTQMELPF